LTIVPSIGGKITPDLFLRMREEADRQRQGPDIFFTDQFNNHDAIRGYMGIGEEILQQLNGKITVYCGGVGTGGMLTGVSHALRAALCGARIVALEPDTSPFLTTGKAGSHRVEGIASGRRPPHLEDVSVYDEARAISEEGAREMSRRLAREEGIFAGTSTGVNVLAAVALARECGPGATVVTVAVDTGLKYLAGDLYSTS
jgi:cysteine synthase A